MPDLRITDLRIGEAMAQEFGLVDHNTPVETVIRSCILKNTGEK